MKKIIIFVLCIISLFCLALSYFNNDISSLNKQSDNYKPLSKIQTTEVNFLGHWLDEGKKEQLLKELINEFEFVNQDITVHLDYLEKMSKENKISENYAQCNAGYILSEKPEWDIIRANNEFWLISRYINDPDWMKKYLVDFSEIPEFVNSTRPELLTDSVKAQYGGIIPGPFLDGYNWTLWCNTEVAKKIGIEVKQYDMSFEDFSGYLKAVFQYNQNHSDSVVGIFEAGDFSTTNTIAEQLFFSEIGDYNEIINNKYSVKKIAAWDKVLHKMEEISKYRVVPKDWKNISWAHNMNDPVDGKCLFFVNGSWMYNIWLKYDSSKLKNMLPCELPVFKTSPICFGGYNITWVVPKKAPHREQAIRFLLYMNSENFGVKWSHYTKSPSGIILNQNKMDFVMDQLERFQSIIDQKYGKHKTILLDNSGKLFGKNNENLPNLSNEVISGEISADVAINSIERKLISN
jgi:ABC-type glycerol-3-phosphate transport system substrate-binding protein